MVKELITEEQGTAASGCLIHSFANTSGRESEPPLPQLDTSSVAELIELGYHLNYSLDAFWDGYRSHFAALGITLCPRLPLGTSYLFDPEPNACNSLPFAIRCMHGRADPEKFRCMQTRFAYGREAHGRDIFIKIIDKGTMEYKIYNKLSQCKALYDSRAFACVLPPTAIVDSPYGFAFIAMPLWGRQLSPVDFDTVRQVMTFIRCTLTGLSFLHKQRIAHRDIHEGNILINWYCNDGSLSHAKQSLRYHYGSATAFYALFDFDLSLQLPPETSLKTCRLPREESFRGVRFYHPADVDQGERDYNPFAFDVACLGNLFTFYFADAIPTMPLLAPLFSKMTTHVIHDRFSAEEALNFVVQIEGNVHSDILDTGIALQRQLDALDDPDLYWNRLPPSFRSRWRDYRPPPLSWTTRFLRRLADTELGDSVISSIRRSLYI